MIHHDWLFKRLIALFFVEFVEAFFPSVARYLDKKSIHLLNQEVYSSAESGDQRILDLVARCKFKNQPVYFLFHVEPMARKERLFGRSMFHYFSLLHQKHGLPVYPVVLFSHGNKVPEPDTYTVSFPDLNVLEFRYRVIQLSRLSWREFLKRKNPVVCALMTKMGVKKEERVQVKLECLRMLLTLKVDKAKQHFLSAFIDTYLRLNAEEALHFNREVDTLPQLTERKQIMELTTSWKEEGRQEGRQEALCENVIEVLETRFGEVPFSLRETLGRIHDPARLKSLLRRAVTVPTLKAFQTQLPPVSKKVASVK